MLSSEITSSAPSGLASSGSSALTARGCPLHHVPNLEYIILTIQNYKNIQRSHPRWRYVATKLNLLPARSNPFSLQKRLSRITLYVITAVAALYPPISAYNPHLSQIKRGTVWFKGWTCAIPTMWGSADYRRTWYATNVSAPLYVTTLSFSSVSITNLSSSKGFGKLKYGGSLRLKGTYSNVMFLEKFNKILIPLIMWSRFHLLEQGFFLWNEPERAAPGQFAPPSTVLRSRIARCGRFSWSVIFRFRSQTVLYLI